MNPLSFLEATSLATSVFDAKKTKNMKSSIIVCPPALYLGELIKGCDGGLFGAQNCSWEEKGAFTGEISPYMIKNIGADYVILGHSERRKHFNESDKTINSKIKAALGAGLKVIICVGEKTRSGFKESEYLDVIRQETNASLEGLLPEDLNGLIFAYEPIWAIGTGIPDVPKESVKSINVIRETISGKFGNEKAGESQVVLYGGSVNSKNATGFLEEEEINGALVGGASLNLNEFLKILEIADNC